MGALALGQHTKTDSSPVTRIEPSTLATDSKLGEVLISKTDMPKGKYAPETYYHSYHRKYRPAIMVCRYKRIGLPMVSI